MELYFLIFWGFVGFTKNSFRFSLWFVELIGEASVKHLEVSSIVLNVVYMGGV